MTTNHASLLLPVVREQVPTVRGGGKSSMVRGIATHERRWCRGAMEDLCGTTTIGRRESGIHAGRIRLVDLICEV